MHDALACGCRFHTLNVVDGFNREALSIEIALNPPALRVIHVLDRLGANRGYPMDNNLEFISLALAEWAEILKLPSKPTQNAFIARFNMTYCTETLDFYLLRRPNEVQKITEKWLSEYNYERPHELLDNMAQ